MRGYKLVDEGILDQYGNHFELNKIYHSDDVKYSKKGFHFSIYPENTLRFSKEKKPTNFIIAEVEANGIIDCGDDTLSNNYYGYDGMYASSDIKLIRLVPRQEILDIVLNSKNEHRVERLIQSIILTNDEIDYIREKMNSKNINAFIEYYQYGNENAFYEYHNMKKTL